MKNSNLYLVFIFCFNFLYAQNNQWSAPINLSDSLHNNLNFDLVNVDYEISAWNWVDSIYIAWEQVIDDSTTRILVKNLHSPNNPIPILHQSGVRFMKPKLMAVSEYSSGVESVYYLFYETNQNNNKDIYYIKYYEDKTFSQPIPFAVSTENEINLDVGCYSVVWQTSDSLLFSSLDNYYNWTQPEVIDTGDCQLPIISFGNYIFWLRNYSDSLKIYFKYWDYQNQQWSNDSLFFGTGSSSYLSSNSHPSGLETLSWQNVKDSISQIYFWNVSYNNEINKLNEFVNYNKYEPSHFITPVITQNEFYEYPLTAFILDSIGKMQVMANDDFMNSNNFQNLSGNSQLNRNPKLFEGEYDGYNLKVYLVWESFQNNHWQLKMRSISFLLASIEDKPYKNVSDYKLFQNYPNPFNPSTNIKFTLPKSENVKIEVFNLLGQKIETLLNKPMPAGSHEIKFTAKDLPSGVYLYRIEAGIFQKVKKMILLR